MSGVERLTIWSVTWHVTETVLELLRIATLLLGFDALLGAVVMCYTQRLQVAEAAHLSSPYVLEADVVSHVAEASTPSARRWRTGRMVP
jgi:hypothetical protein